MNPRIFYLNTLVTTVSPPLPMTDSRHTPCLRSGFALPSLPMWESKGIQIGKKHHSFLHVFYKMLFSIKYFL